MNTNRFATVQFFVDNGMIYMDRKLSKTEELKDSCTQLLYNNMLLKVLYKKLVKSLTKLRLAVETDKLELMHFIRKHKNKKLQQWTDNEPLGSKSTVKDGNMSYIISSKISMRYFRFMLDPKLTFTSLSSKE